MSNEIVRAQPAQITMAEQMQFSQIVTEGDLVPQSYRGKPANALVAIGLGQAMGLSPAESLYRIDVIQGKPTASAELIASNVRKAGHKLRVEVDEQSVSVTATVWRADDPEFPHSVTRDMAWAQKMGLNTKDNYKKQPLTMLQWRAISAVARLACSEALYGVTYTPDEVEDLPSFRAAPRVQQAPPVAEPVAESISPEQWNEIQAAALAAGLDQGAMVALIVETIGRELPGPGSILAAEYETIMARIAPEPPSEPSEQ